MSTVVILCTWLCKMWKKSLMCNVGCKLKVISVFYQNQNVKIKKLLLNQNFHYFSLFGDFMPFQNSNRQSFSFRTPSHFFSFLFDFMFFRQTNNQVLFIILDIRSFSLPTPSHFFSFLFDFMLFRQTFCHLISSSNFVESGACPKYF